MRKTIRDGPRDGWVRPPAVIMRELARKVPRGNIYSIRGTLVGCRISAYVADGTITVEVPRAMNPLHLEDFFVSGLSPDDLRPHWAYN